MQTTVKRITTTDHSMRVLGEHALTLDHGSEARAAIMLLLGKFGKAPAITNDDASAQVALQAVA